MTVSLELTYPGLFVMFSRLVDGKIPPYPIDVAVEPVLHNFYLDDIVALRAPTEVVQYDPRDLWDPRKVAELLYVDALLTRKHAADILRGDFLVFSTLEQIVRNRDVRLKLGLEG